MRQNPERLAWTVLLTAFITFCLVAISCPLTVRNYLRNARKPLHAQVNAQRGTVRVERGNSSRVDAVGGDDSAALEIFVNDNIRTGELDEGLVVLQRGDANNRETLISIVVFANSEVVLEGASSPRFGLSPHPHQSTLRVRGGRVRIEVQPAADERPVQVEVLTDHARIVLREGSYALETTNQQTTVTVRRGSATAYAGDKNLSIRAEERATASLEGELVGPLPAERNLILNGDLSDGIDTRWTQFSVSQSGTARVTSATDVDGQTIALFQHDQAEPSETSLVQTLNRNVRGLSSLVLHVKVRVDYQSLSVCGSQGTECPVMVRIDYIDVAGGSRQWVHGFYAYEDPAQAGANPYYCLVCPPPNSGNHSRVPEKAWFLYDSPNLMALEPPELRPAIIQSVRVYASGHSYESMVTDVELLAQE